MPFLRPTLAALRQRIRGQFQARLPGADMRPRRSVLGVHADVLGGELWEEYGYLDYIVDQMLPDTATDYLARWMAIYNLTPQGAIQAAGNVVFTGTATTPIPAGTLVQDGSGVQFATTAAAVLVGGGTATATVGVLAVVGGANGNEAGGTVLTMPVAIAGVAGNPAFDGSGAPGGADSESITSQRQRLLLRIRQPPQGGAAPDYIQWALEVAGVTRAWCLPLMNGAGTVGVTFMMDGRVNPIPLTGDVTAVQAFINAVRPVTATPTVFAPTADTLALTIHGLLPSNATVKAAIAASYADILMQKASPGAPGGITVWGLDPAGSGVAVPLASPGLIAFADIDDSVSQAAGVSYHLLSSPSTDHTSAAGGIAVPGTITYT
jgi:uncharacterized phage protein gp47/JayE